MAISSKMAKTAEQSAARLKPEVLLSQWLLFAIQEGHVYVPDDLINRTLTCLFPQRIEKKESIKTEVLQKLLNDCAG